MTSTLSAFPRRGPDPLRRAEAADGYRPASSLMTGTRARSAALSFRSAKRSESFLVQPRPRSLMRSPSLFGVQVIVTTDFSTLKEKVLMNCEFHLNKPYTSSAG